jgi:uncharacterized protein YrrD
MLQKLSKLYGNKLAASDGDLGHVKDFYFDDNTWAIRYLVADTGSWLTGRQVLLSPHAFGRLDQDGMILHVTLSRKQIEDSPSIDSQKPVSRQYEVAYYGYYGWPPYWAGTSMWGLSNYPMVMPLSTDEVETHPQYHHREDTHLRSTRAVTGYDIQAADGMIGHVSGFLVDDRSWAIRELVVETGHWFSGKEILISPSKIDRISYAESKVFVKLTKADIQETAENEVAKANAANHRAENVRT